jgi:hypothetical protein
MYCGGGHLGFPIGIKNKKFVENLPMIIPGQFGFNCSSGSSLKPHEQLKPNCPGMIIGRFSTNCMFFMPIGNPRWPPKKFVENLPMIIHGQFGFNYPSGFREEAF